MGRHRHSELVGRIVLVTFVAALATLAIGSERSARRDARRIARLEKTFAQAIERGGWRDAAAIGARLDVATGASDAGLAYNLACAQARLGASDTAGSWLVAAAERGFSGVHLAETDADLASIRDSDGYRRAIAVMRASAEARLAAFRERAADVEPRVILPPGHDPRRPAPLIVVLHGTGGTGEGLARFWRGAAATAGAILVAPDGLRPHADGFEWRFVDESEWLVIRTIERVAARHAIDRERIVLAGFSQGASIALVVGTRRPERFCGLIPIAGLLEPEALDLARPRARRPRIALLVGGADPTMRSYRTGLGALRRAGFEVSLDVFPRVGHTMPKRYEAVFTEALGFVCPPARE